MRKIFISWLLILFISFSFLRTIFACVVSDKEAIIISKLFCDKHGIAYSEEPWVIDTSYDWATSNSLIKEVVFGKKGDFKLFIKVSCSDKDVVHFLNSAVMKQVRSKFGIPWVTTEALKWPPYLNEQKAKEIIFNIANRIGLPLDVEFSAMGLDKENAIWSGLWIRKKDGFQYERDDVRIEILAVDGEFYSYSKTFRGQLCPTEVKIRKEEAIEEGWRQVEKLFKSDTWEKHKADFEVKSVELKIVQPNVLAGRMISLHSSKSRLAWKITYGLKTKPDRRKLIAIAFKQRVIIKIDAATKKFLGGDYSQ